MLEEEEEERGEHGGEVIQVRGGHGRACCDEVVLVEEMRGGHGRAMLLVVVYEEEVRGRVCCEVVMVRGGLVLLLLVVVHEEVRGREVMLEVEKVRGGHGTTMFDVVVEVGGGVFFPNTVTGK